MNSNDLESQMKFIIEIDKLKSIFRQNYLIDSSRRENDSEHSWHLSMMVITLADHFENIDVCKTVKMVLIHDLVEIYAGDTFAYDESANIGKEQREKESAKKLFSLLPRNQSDKYIKLWYEFEDMTTSESVFANIVDRLQLLLLNVYSKGKMWHKRKVTLENVLKREKPIFDKAPRVITKYFNELINESIENNYFYIE
ncbi:MAG: HD domain-containing protein [Clostridiales bacterium]